MPGAAGLPGCGAAWRRAHAGCGRAEGVVAGTRSWPRSLPLARRRAALTAAVRPRLAAARRAWTPRHPRTAPGGSALAAARQCGPQWAATAGRRPGRRGRGPLPAGPGRWAAGGAGSVSRRSRRLYGRAPPSARSRLIPEPPAAPPRGRWRLAWPRPAAFGAAPSPPALAAWPANSSLSLRTTGASIVEDADRQTHPSPGAWP